jgi:hypothetical protein
MITMREVLAGGLLPRCATRCSFPTRISACCSTAPDRRCAPSWSATKLPDDVRERLMQAFRDGAD